MDAFNFTFTLFGLLLGFTLVEILSGLAKVLKARSLVRLGWLTPLLAVFVMLDVLSFWTLAWEARAVIPVTYATLLAGLVVTATYYLAASWIFPEVLEVGVDLDAHYLSHHRPVLSVIWLCNAVTFTGDSWRLGWHLSPMVISLVGAYWLLIGVAALSNSKPVNIIALSGLIAIYLTNAVLPLIVR